MRIFHCSQKKYHLQVHQSIFLSLVSSLIISHLPLIFLILSPLSVFQPNWTVFLKLVTCFLASKFYLIPLLLSGTSTWSTPCLLSPNSYSSFIITEKAFLLQSLLWFPKFFLIVVLRELKKIYRTSGIW